MNMREKMDRAMRLKGEGPVPVHCQLAIGHTLLQAGCNPVDYNFTSEVYAGASVQVQARYGFDGVLLHKPGRDPEVLSRARRESHPDGEVLLFDDGGRILCTADDDPKYYPPDGWRFPSVVPAGQADPLGGFRDSVDLLDPLAHLPQSYLDWNTHKGLHFITDPGGFPEFYFAAIDRVIETTEHAISVHGEVKAPHDYLLNLLGIEHAMLAMLVDPELCEALLELSTRAASAWAEAQVRRGCDAIKLSSPYAGNGFISRDFYETYVLPSERRVVQAIHEAGGVAYTHTCGSIGDRIDLMVETGVDGIEAMDPPPLGDSDLAAIKSAHGGRIFLKGNLDSVNVLLQGRPEAVRKATRHCLEIAAPGGGYVLSSACSVSPRAPSENIHAMVETVHAYNKEHFGQA